MRNSGSRRERIRLFQSDWLERLTLVTPLGFAAAWLIMLGCAVLASWGVAGIIGSVCLVAAGLVIWTLFEYALHRFVFHLKTSSRFGRHMLFMTHGNHHAAPNDPLRSLMPPVVSIIVAGSIWGGFWLVLGPPGSVLFLGFGIGYVIYDVLHYACHQLPMRGRLLQRLREHHIRHHFSGDEGNYAVTAIFWDARFGTRVPSKSR